MTWKLTNEQTVHLTPVKTSTDGHTAICRAKGRNLGVPYWMAFVDGGRITNCHPLCYNPADFNHYTL